MLISELIIHLAWVFRLPGNFCVPSAPLTRLRSQGVSQSAPSPGRTSWATHGLPASPVGSVPKPPQVAPSRTPAPRTRVGQRSHPFCLRNGGKRALATRLPKSGFPPDSSPPRLLPERLRVVIATQDPEPQSPAMGAAFGGAGGGGGGRPLRHDPHSARGTRCVLNLSRGSEALESENV